MSTFQQIQMILLADLLIRHTAVPGIARDEPMCVICRVPAPCGIYTEAQRLIDTFP